MLNLNTLPATSGTTQNAGQNTLGAEFLESYQNYDVTPSAQAFRVHGANVIGYNAKFNQADPTIAGAAPIAWSGADKLLGGGGFVTKIAIRTSLGEPIPNARFRIQMMAKDENGGSPTNQYLVLGTSTSTGDFDAANAKPGFMQFNCDPTSASSCLPLPAADTVGGVNPTTGDGEAYMQTNADGFTWVWSTMHGTSASNLYNFALRVSDAQAADTTLFPADNDFSRVFPAYVPTAPLSMFAPESTALTRVPRTAPFFGATVVTSVYSSMTFFKLTSDCLGGSTLPGFDVNICGVPAPTDPPTTPATDPATPGSTKYPAGAGNESSYNSLTFTGYAALPIVGGAAALLVAGLASRVLGRRRQHS